MILQLYLELPSHFHLGLVCAFIHSAVIYWALPFCYKPAVLSWMLRMSKLCHLHPWLVYSKRKEPDMHLYWITAGICPFIKSFKAWRSEKIPLRWMSLPGLSALIWPFSPGKTGLGPGLSGAVGSWSFISQDTHGPPYVLFLCWEKWKAHEGSIGQFCTQKKKKNAFDAIQRTALLLGRKRNWRLGVHLGSGSCSSGTRGFLQGVVMWMRL